jgi:hypothetical protein
MVPRLDRDDKMRQHNVAMARSRRGAAPASTEWGGYIRHFSRNFAVMVSDLPAVLRTVLRTASEPSDKRSRFIALHYRIERYLSSLPKRTM